MIVADFIGTPPPALGDRFAAPAFLLAHDPACPDRGSMNVLVTGATGYVGGRLVPRLLEAGHSVRALARDPRRLAGRRSLAGASAVSGDLLDPSSLEGAFD
jgi:hypothetical protein